MRVKITLEEKGVEFGAKDEDVLYKSELLL